MQENLVGSGLYNSEEHSKIGKIGEFSCEILKSVKSMAKVGEICQYKLVLRAKKPYHY